MDYSISPPTADVWTILLTAARMRDGAKRRAMLGSLATGDDLAALYAPLLGAEMASRPYVVAHLAQSLDGCIALPAGESQWISGHDDLVHTHRLRALCDAVLVGARTVMHDDPQLTVRHVEGPHPLRVILDPRGRLNANYQVFEGGPERTLVVARAPRPDLEGRVEVVLLPSDEAWVAPSVVLEVLAQRGIQRVLVEGGGITVSRFLEAGLVDRLHLVMAPLLVGLGRPSLSGSLGATLASCPRPSTRVWPLGQDWLFDCVFA